MSERTEMRGRVLVVEDEAYVRDSLVEILRARRFDAVAAGSVAEALAHLGHRLGVTFPRPHNEERRCCHASPGLNTARSYYRQARRWSEIRSSSGGVSDRKEVEWTTRAMRFPEAFP